MTVEQRLDQLEKRNKRLTVALTMMAMVAITIQFSACGNDCDVSDVKALAGRDLTECYDLAGADLKGATLTNANLYFVALEGADLRRAKLTNADLEGANLANANLKDADLAGANLKNANLKNADL
jgi:uncharacterized protein YjbI with pentapeptide repeats